MAPSSILDIPQSTLDSMLKYMQMVDKTPLIKLDDLKYLKIPFFGFDEKRHIGEMIVHTKVANEVVLIFEELYKYKFPIEKMHLIEKYEASDDASMKDNNSSAFCYRHAVGKPGILSKHSFGLAIDINPLYNPYVKGDIVLPPDGKKYANRTERSKGMIFPNEICAEAFLKRGWVWGGLWPDRQDYHHFQKEIDL